MSGKVSSALLAFGYWRKMCVPSSLGVGWTGFANRYNTVRLWAVCVTSLTSIPKSDDSQ